MIKELLRVSVLNNGRKLDFSKMSFFSLKILFFSKNQNLIKESIQKMRFFCCDSFLKTFKIQESYTFIKENAHPGVHRLSTENNSNVHVIMYVTLS
jgi:hypothetical protein